MSIKKIALATLIVLVLLVIYAMPASAANGWYTVKIVQMGPSNNGKVYVRLTDEADTPAFTRTWFTCLDSQINRQMAIILTAMTNDMALQVYVDPTLADVNNRIVYAMYLFTNES